MWEVLENGIWAALAAASVLTIASLFDSVAHRGRLSRAVRRARGQLADAARLIRGGGGEGASHDPHALRYVDHPLAQFYSWALDPARDGSPELMAAGLLEECDGGRIRTAQFFARLSPLLGLSGTVVGLIQQFIFAAESGEQALSTGAFGYCLFTTLAGIGIAAVALVTSALVQEPALRSVQHELTNAVLAAQGQRSNGTPIDNTPQPERGGENHVPPTRRP